MGGIVERLAQRQAIFVGGKGGVGKTTTAAALALALAERSGRTLVVSTDPAHSLGDAFDCPLGADARALTDRLDALELDPHRIVHEHFAQIEKTLAGYARPEMLPRLRDYLRLSMHAPGAEEAAMLESVCRLLVSAEEKGYRHIVFDTAPTGHTLRLLTLPEMMGAWTQGLLAHQQEQKRLREAAQPFWKGREKERSNPFRADKNARFQDALEVLEIRRELFVRARQMLHDEAHSAMVLVMIAETLPLQETRRAVKQLQQAGLPCRELVLNQIIADGQADAFWQQRHSRQQHIIAQAQQLFADQQLSHIPLQASDVRGQAALREFVDKISDPVFS